MKYVVLVLTFVAILINGIVTLANKSYDFTTIIESSATIGLDSQSSSAIDSKTLQQGGCDRVLLYATDYLNPNGLVAQLNTFLRAVLTAIVEDRRLVFLHSNEESMFGCPGFHNKDSSESSVFYPGGLGHVLDVSLLSHQCPPPSCHRIQKWHRLAYRIMQKKNIDAHITCRDSINSSTFDVLLLGGFALRDYFRDEIQPILEQADNLEDWGKRLGIRSSTEIQSLQRDAHKNATQSSYRSQVMRLVKPFVQFQPWIVKDVKELFNNYTQEVPFREMIGIHIRRGDKLKVESRFWVEDYWTKQGFKREDMPVNYVPLIAYLEKISAPYQSIRDVYIATDDRETIQKEIQELPDHSLWRFHFNSLATSGHLNSLEDCHGKYQHTIAAIFDLMVLEACKLFVGEYNSNWGRWIRFRREGEIRVVFGPSDVSWPR